MAVDDAYTKVLLHMNGTDASTTFTDESGKTWTASNQAQIDTAQSKFGGASGLFDGTGDYISTSDHADFNMGSDDWTIDFWIRQDVLQNNTVFEQTDGTEKFEIFFGALTGRFMCVCADASGDIWRFRADFGMSADTWYHIAIVRSGGTPYMFKDGTSLTVTEDTAISGKTAPDIAASPQIGDGRIGNGLYGWVDEFRFSNGIARWTANFTPPTKEYEPITGFQHVAWWT
jgi:hypothetical protein